jgi:glucan 1,3-beta-glucosidase
MASDKYENVWLDCHLYHHTDHVDAAGPSAVRTLVDRSRKYLARARRSGLPTMVGEWSASLPYAETMMTPEGQIALARVYVSEQLSAFSDCPGWFFQTWKTSGRLVGWDARVALATFERRMLD